MKKRRNTKRNATYTKRPFELRVVFHKPLKVFWVMKFYPSLRRYEMFVFLEVNRQNCKCRYSEQ